MILYTPCQKIKHQYERGHADDYFYFVTGIHALPFALIAFDEQSMKTNGHETYAG